MVWSIVLNMVLIGVVLRHVLIALENVMRKRSDGHLCDEYKALRVKPRNTAGEEGMLAPPQPKNKDLRETKRHSL